MRGRIFLTIYMVSFFFGCSDDMPPGFIASGIVESQTYSVSTTTSGRIISMMVEEGTRVKRDQLCMIVDTIPIKLKMQELEARKAELNHTIAARGAEIESKKTEVRGLAREFGRISKLVEKGSAAQQRKDELGTQVKSADHSLEAAQQMQSALVRKRDVLESQMAILQNQLKDCYVISPADGIVLTKYRNRGEMAAPGGPLFDVGAFDTMHVDFFVPQTLLSQIQIGQNIRLRLDRSDERSDHILLDAQIVWISEEAEFTPRNVQTRESRNELMFRIRARADNKKRLLKRGLPVEIWRAE